MCTCLVKRALKNQYQELEDPRTLSPELSLPSLRSLSSFSKSLWVLRAVEENFHKSPKVLLNDGRFEVIICEGDIEQGQNIEIKTYSKSCKQGLEKAVLSVEKCHDHHVENVGNKLCQPGPESHEQVEGVLFSPLLYDLRSQNSACGSFIGVIFYVDKCE